MTTYEFDTDTAVAAVGDGRYEATVSGRWGVPDGPPNGGYLLAIAAHALADHLDRPHPVTLTSHFVAPAQAGPATVEIETVRPGGRHATGAARLIQEGREVARFLGAFTDLARASGPTLVAASPPTLPPLEACVASPEDADGILGRFDYRLVPEDQRWRQGDPTGAGRARGYIAFRDGRPLDPVAVAAITDAFAPAVFDLGLAPGWVPTIELTTHVRAIPAPGHLRCLVTTRFVTDGYLEEDTEVWDSEGRFIAQSRQLALAPRP